MEMQEVFMGVVSVVIEGGEVRES